MVVGAYGVQEPCAPVYIYFLCEGTNLVSLFHAAKIAVFAYLPSISPFIFNFSSKRELLSKVFRIFALGSGKNPD